MLRVGILGAGFFGAFHARAIAATPSVQLAAVCDARLELAQAIAAEHGGKASADWSALLADASIDAVVIATPHHLHRDMAVAAAEAGKHILLEKPMARTAAECSAVIAAAERAGVKLMVGQLLHFALPCLVARRIIDSGELGRPVTGFATLSKLWMEPNRRSWHLDPATGGGMLMTAGIHVLDLLIWMMGEPAQAVSAAVGALFHEQAADDSALLLLRFPDGRFGQVREHRLPRRRDDLRHGAGVRARQPAHRFRARRFGRQEADVGPTFPNRPSRTGCCGPWSASGRPWPPPSKARSPSP